MKTLSLEQMENLKGGSWRTILICTGLGAMYSIANPILGIAVGVACAVSAERNESGKAVPW
jgi:hypothetical protein